jgi:hypothetical protein
MTTTKTSTATAATVNKQPSLAERVATLLMITAITTFPLQELFNAFVANVYNYHELSFQLAFLILFPLIVGLDYIRRVVKAHFIYQDTIYRELASIRAMNEYNTEYTIGTYNVITAATNAIYTQTVKPVDTEQNLS